MPLAFYQLGGTSFKAPEFQKYTKKVVCRIRNFNSFLKSFLNSAKPFTTVPFEKTKKNIITSYHLHFSLHFRALCIAHSLCNFQLYFISFCL